LRSKEKEIFHSEENALAREQSLFSDLVAKLLDESIALAQTADTLAELDVLAEPVFAADDPPVDCETTVPPVASPEILPEPAVPCPATCGACRAPAPVPTAFAGGSTGPRPASSGPTSAIAAVPVGSSQARWSGPGNARRFPLGPL
jgi:hypothetical protein